MSSPSLTEILDIADRIHRGEPPARKPNLGDVQSAAKRLVVVDLLNGPLYLFSGHQGYRSHARPRAMLHRLEVVESLAKAGVCRINDDDTATLEPAAEPLAQECLAQFVRVLPEKRS